MTISLIIDQNQEFVEIKANPNVRSIKRGVIAFLAIRNLEAKDIDVTPPPDYWRVKVKTAKSDTR